MFWIAANFAARRVGWAACVALCLPVAAQQTIQFSKPANQDPVDTANAFLPNHTAPPAFNAPTSLFGNSGRGTTFDVLPMGPQAITLNPNADKWKKFLDDKKNWTLMTPEQILGLPTPEKILGINDPREDSKLSPEEIFLRRHDPRTQLALSNNLHRADAPLWRSDDQVSGLFRESFSSVRPDGTPGNSSSRAANPGPAKVLGIFSNGDPRSLSDGNRDVDSPWTSAFGTSEPLPKQTPEQLAGLERFRAILERPSQEKPVLATPFSLQPVPRDPNMQSLPAYNPAGRSFSALQSDIGKPTGLAPLSGVTGPRPAPPKKTPLVQPPPWMSDSLQSPTMPQRQF